MDKNNFIMSYSVDKAFDSDQFLKLRLRVCHDGESPNHTYFTKETMAEANKSLEYIPLLAHVYVDQETGKPVIGSHDMHVEEDKLNEGETRVIYDETPIGVVPALADNNCSIEEYDGLNYTFVDCYLWRDYANYAEPLVEDAENTKLSMEIDFPEEALSYDAANDRYNISSYRYRGITLLNEALGTGMKNALATTANFSVNEDIKSKMIVLMEELQQCLRDYDKNDSDEKGGNVDMENEEVVETMIEETVEEVVEEVMEEETEHTEESVVENMEETPVEEAPAEESPATEEFSEGEEDVLVCTFRISHDDIKFGLQSLLNAICDESHFYSVIAVYDKYFYYCDYFSGDAFKQSYKMRKDVVSFDGDPEPVYTEFVTQAEKDELENMRKNYAELVAFKEGVVSAQLKAEKTAVLESAEYVEIKDSAEFKALVSEMDQHSTEDLKVKADLLFAASMKKKFALEAESAEKKHSVGMNFNAKTDKKKEAYEGLFND